MNSKPIALMRFLILNKRLLRLSTRFGPPKIPFKALSTNEVFDSKQELV
jgi:hypothetical protein